jgi:hypothetical protein
LSEDKEYQQREFARGQLHLSVVFPRRL